MAKSKAKKSNSLMGLIIVLGSLVLIYLGAAASISSIALKEDSAKWYVSIHDHATAVMKFISDYGSILVLIALALVAVIIFARTKKK